MTSFVLLQRNFEWNTACCAYFCILWKLAQGSQFAV